MMREASAGERAAILAMRATLRVFALKILRRRTAPGRSPVEEVKELLGHLKKCFLANLKILVSSLLLSKGSPSVMLRRRHWS